MRKYVNVVLYSNARVHDRLYTYFYNVEKTGELNAGACVFVHFGRSNKLVRAFVVDNVSEAELSDEIQETQIKEIIGVDRLNSVDDATLEICSRIKNQIGCRLFSILKKFLPKQMLELDTPLINKGDQQVAAGEAEYDVENKASQEDDSELIQKVNKKNERSIKNYFKQLEKLSPSPNGCKANERKDVSIDADFTSVENSVVLTEAQKAAYLQIDELAKINKPCLFHGVSGSGKTEISFIRALESYRNRQDAILLYPEKALAIDAYKRMKATYGAEIKDNLLLITSDLRGSQERALWYHIRFKATPTIIIGTRQAVFAPLNNLDFIGVDEEQDQAYIEEQTPKYNLINVAYLRSRHEHAHMLLMSASPSIGSYYKAKNDNLGLVTINESYTKSEKEVFFVSLEDELKAGNNSLFSRKLFYTIDDVISKGRQCILVINRRGYANRLYTKEDNKPLLCSRCEKNLTYHKSKDRFICGYCNHVEKHKIDDFILKGAGVERVAELFESFFPDAKCGIYDVDHRDENALESFNSGELDAIITTHSLTKGMDFKNVSLLAFINTDYELMSSQYFSEERNFSLITQSLGRLGRSGQKSSLILQYFTAPSKTIIQAIEGKYEEFYMQEIEHRKKMQYPPFTDIINITIRGINNKKVISACSKLREILVSLYGDNNQIDIFNERLEQKEQVENPYYVYMTLRSKKNIRNDIVKTISNYGNKLGVKGNGKGLILTLDVNL